jgi:hypothetical protein
MDVRVLFTLVLTPQLGSMKHTQEWKLTNYIAGEDDDKQLERSTLPAGTNMNGLNKLCTSLYRKLVSTPRTWQRALRTQQASLPIILSATSSRTGNDSIRT